MFEKQTEIVAGLLFRLFVLMININMLFKLLNNGNLILHAHTNTHMTKNI